MEIRNEKCKKNSLNELNGKENEEDKKSELKTSIFDRFENEMNRFKRVKKVDESTLTKDIHREAVEFYFEIKNQSEEINSTYYNENINNTRKENLENEFDKEYLFNPNCTIKLISYIRQRVSSLLLKFNSILLRKKSESFDNRNESNENNTKSNDKNKNHYLINYYLVEIDSLKSKISEYEKMISSLYKEREADKITIETLKNKILFNNTNYYINTEFNGEESIYKSSINNMNPNLNSQYSADFNKFKESKSSTTYNISNNTNSNMHSSLNNNYMNNSQNDAINIGENNMLHLMSFADCRDKNLIGEINQEMNIKELLNKNQIKKNYETINILEQSLNKKTDDIKQNLKIEELNTILEKQKKEFETKIKEVENINKEVRSIFIFRKYQH